MATSASTSFYLILGLFIYLTHSIKIKTKLGEIEGITAANGVHQFLNLPYAEPPINELRWRPTQPLKNKFASVYNATSFGNACVQPTVIQGFNVDPDRTEPISYTEDCLYLNVYTPYNFDTKANQPLLPILFWIHGGGLVIGTAMVPIYHGYKLAKSQNIIVVSINYRLGRAAWFIDPRLDDSPTGNGGANGFLDMIEALKWTRDNIESFGGDKNEITIAGESGGGVAVCGLVLSPLAKGLFQRSIQMSGSCIKSMGRLRTKRETYAMQKKIHGLIGVTAFEEMRTMDMQQIVDVAYGEFGVRDAPSTDGYVFPLDSIELLSRGNVNGESVMIGTLFQESFAMAPFNMGVLSKNETDLNAFYFRYLFDSEVKLLQKYYPTNAVKKVWSLEKSYFNSTTEIVQATEQTDCWVRCGSIKQTEMISNNPITKESVSVYFYQFGTYKEPFDSVTHGYDVGALFGMINPEYSPFPVAEDAIAYTDGFIESVMNFFGEYVKGIGPLNAYIGPLTVQNGYYLRVIEEDVRVMDLSALNVVKERCKVWDLLGDDIFDNNAICFGMEPMTEEMKQAMMEQFAGSSAADSNDTCDTDSCDAAQL